MELDVFWKDWVQTVYIYYCRSLTEIYSYANYRVCKLSQNFFSIMTVRTVTGYVLPYLQLPSPKPRTLYGDTVALGDPTSDLHLFQGVLSRLFRK